ncbi:MAG: SlyX family protein [Gammaproteobacteria bacterium]
MNTLEQRVDELEAKVSFLELANQQMSDLMYSQQREFDLQFQRISAQLERIDTDSSPATSLKDEIPPHY